MPAERFGARLCIDAMPLLVRSAGVKNYLHHWIAHLRRLSEADRVTLFPYIGDPGSLDHERSTVRRCGTAARLALFHALNRRPNRLLDWMLPGIDVFHAAKLLNPPTRARLTATVHDATCHLMPQFHTPANVRAEKLFTERVLKRADAVIAVSENTRRDAIEALGLDARRVHVIYHGIASEYFNVPLAQVEEARRRFDLRRPYVLFVGTVEPRKNLATLLDAYESLPRDVRDEFDLVVAGPAGWECGDVLARLRAPAPGVRYLGYVPEPLLPGLFGGATVFAYISLYEGFGFPVAQAMAAGAPVLTSAVSALPEVTAGAAELVDPRSLSAARAALCMLLTSPARRMALSADGRARAERFQWQTCALESLRLFEAVCGAR